MNLKIQTQTDKFTLGNAFIKEYSTRERSIRAIKIGGGFLAGAAAAVLLPVLHFVLVPGFLTTSPIMFWVRYTQAIQLSDAKFSCPECNKEIFLKNTSGNWPLKSVCPFCFAQMYLTKNVSSHS